MRRWRRPLVPPPHPGKVLLDCSFEEGGDAVALAVLTSLQRVDMPMWQDRANEATRRLEQQQKWAHAIVWRTPDFGGGCCHRTNPSLSQGCPWGER